MTIARKTASMLLATASLMALGAGVGPTPAHASATVLHSALEASGPGDPLLLGVSPMEQQWQLGSGVVRLFSDGRFAVVLRRLHLTEGHSTGPVRSLDASLYCAGLPIAVATSESVALRPSGRAEIRTTLALPAPCFAPVVLLHPQGIAALYIAASA